MTFDGDDPVEFVEAGNEKSWIAPTGRLLWEHQVDAISQLEAAIAAGVRRLVTKIPTGGGKTVMAGALYLKKYDGARCGFWMPRLDLITQTIRSFRACGITDLGVMQADHPMTNAKASIQLCSEQTLSRRAIPQFDVIFIDECHFLVRRILKYLGEPALRDIPVIGLSATPWQKGMGLHYDKLINPTSIQELIQRNILCPFTVYCEAPPDLRNVRTTAGDYNDADLSVACDKAVLCANIVKTWQSKGENRPTILFGIDRKHARHLEERFIEAGVKAEYVDGTYLMHIREEIFQRFRAGETKVICSINTMEVGVDLPVCSCIIDARPTKSLIRFYQSCGRGLRTDPGKTDCIFLDHSGNTKRLGLLGTVDCDYLDDGDMKKSPERDKSRPEPKIDLCPECNAVQPKPRPSKCGQCGYVFFTVTQYHERPGELEKYGSGESGSKQASYSREDKRNWYGALKWIVQERGQKPGRVYHLYCEKFREKPPWDWQATVSAAPPNLEQRNYVRSRAIAYYKAIKNG